MNESNEWNAQCLIFVPCNKRQRVARASQSFAEQPEISGYVMIRQSFVRKFPEVIEFFSHCDIQIVTGNQDCANFQTALKNQRFGIFEVQLEYEPDPVELRRIKFRTRSRNVPGHFIIRVYGRVDIGTAQLLLRVSEEDVTCFALYIGNRYTTAIDERNLEILRTVLPFKVDIDNLHSQGGTILHFATQINEVAFVNLLLEKQYCVNIKGLGGLTPLHIAAKSGHLDIAESLLQHGANVDARATFRSFKDCTPLVLAVYYGHLAVFKLLLSNASDVDVIFNSDLGTSILELAVKQQYHLDFVKSILEYQPDVNDKRHRKALLIALCYEKHSFPHIKNSARSFPRIPHDETVQKMLEYGFSVDIERVENLSDVLFGAVHKNCIEIVRTVLQMGVDVNQLRQPSFSDRDHFSLFFTPLHVAVEAGNEDIISLLIDQGADVNSKCMFQGCNGKFFEQKSPISIAAGNGQFNITKLLLLNGANVRNDPRVMREAALNGNLQIFELLLQNDALLNSEASESPVDMAICEENVELLEVLFNYGAQLKSKYEPCPNLIRYTFKRPQILQFLLDLSLFNPSFITTSGIVQFFCNFTDDYNARFRYLFDSDEEFQNAFRRSAYIVARHVIKLETVDLFASDQNVASFWYSQENIDDFRNACAVEIAKMKQDKVCDIVDDETEENKITVTFYDILTPNLKQLAGYAKNELIVEAMETECYKTKFPIFAGVIKCQFQKGHHRAKLVKEGIKSSNHLFKNCKAVASKKINMEMILDYLSNRDLLSLNNVFPAQT